MNSRLNNVVRVGVLLGAALVLPACGGGASRPGNVSHPGFISFGPGVHGLTEHVKQKDLEVCLTGVDAGTEWKLWEDNIRSVVLKWVDALRPIAAGELTRTVTVKSDQGGCDAFINVAPGTWSNTQIGTTPTVRMDRTGYFASYNVLLHEFGHAFALADTYQGGQSGNCRPNQPQAVMCNTAFDTPQEDDVQGIRAVYQSTFPNG